jgi:hypothetical protein
MHFLKENIKNANKGKLFLVALVLCLNLQAIAQEEADSIETPSTSKISIGLSSGTNALLGVDVAYNVVGPLTLKVGYTSFNYNLEGLEQDLNGINALVDAFVARNSITALAEFAPFKSRYFRIVAGAGYFIDNEATAILTVVGSTDFNDIVLAPEDIGTVGVRIAFDQINPYVGVGIGRTIKNDKKLSLSFDMGAYYLGQADVSITATEFLKSNTENEQPLEDNLNEISLWWPTVSLRLGYSF